MDGLDLILYWNTLMIAGVVVALPTAPASFAIGCAMLLIGGPVALALSPDTASWIALPALVFLVAPAALSLLVARAATAGRIDRASRLAFVLTILHPSRGERASLRLWRALARLQRGDEAGACRRLRALTDDAAVGHVARTWLCETPADFAALDDDPRLDAWGARARLRQLGASGRVGAMIDLYRSLLARRQWQLAGVERQRATTVLARVGRVDGVATLRSMAPASSELSALEEAVARIASGEGDAGLAAIRDLSGSRDGLIRRRALFVLRHPPEPVGPLDPDRAAFLDRLEAALPALAPQPSLWRAPATFGVIALCLAVYLVEAVVGQPTDGRTLYDLGALPVGHFAWPDASGPGDSWRLAAAMLLHAGPIHLGANVFGLLVLGPTLERGFGPWRLLTLFLVSGVAANVGCVLLGDAGLLHASLIVGASGAIMGLVGGAFGAALRGLIATRARIFVRRIALMALVIALQVAIDRTIPHVSTATHMLGAAAGFVLGLVLRFRWPASVTDFAERVEPTAQPMAAKPSMPTRPAWLSRLAVGLVLASFASSFWLLLARP